MSQPINLEIYQCDMAFYMTLRRLHSDFKKTPLRVFCVQKNQALRRGIPWRFTIQEWWQVWQQSGCWERRGRRSENYVMARFLDTGAYEVGNVYVCQARMNLSYMYVGITAEGNRKTLRVSKGWPPIATKIAAEKRIAMARKRRGDLR